MRGRYVALVFFAAVAGIAGGIVLERLLLTQPGEAADSGPKILYWVAPMDANYRRDGPGKSPMGMDLVPVYEGQEPSGDPSEVQLSGTIVNSIGVRTALARMEPIEGQVETVGFVKYDEHLISHIHTRLEGWIEDLSVRAVGDRVRKGDLLFSIYAPKITVASAELQRAVRSGHLAETANLRRQLANFGVSDAEIDEMIEAPEPVQHVRFYAPRDGVVTLLDAADGMYLRPEGRAMSIVDLSTVWLLVDVFERDVARVSGAKQALARFEHLPGRVFEGTIDYVYPELDSKTRTLPVRLKFDNSEGLLRPNMFGKVTLVAPVEREAVTIPTEAVIRTGRAERVILKTGEGRFRPRLITTGLTDSFGGGSRTEVVQGLEPGEEVVASAQFLLDSESALNAGLLRMTPTESEPAEGQGILVGLDPKRRLAMIRHEPLAALDWPAMETAFTVRSDVSLDGLLLGDEVEFTIFRGADGSLALSSMAPNDGIDAIGTGVVEAVTPDGKLTLNHDAIPELGWPAMTMDLAVEGIDPADVPRGTPVSFDLKKGADGLFTITAVRDGSDTTGGGDVAEPDAVGSSMTMTVDGTINSVDPVTRTANLTHGDLVDIGMPGMTMDFSLAKNLDPDLLKPGPANLTILRTDDGALVLADARPAPQMMRVAGRINSIDAETRVANVSHGPMVEIGMPGMTMDFPVADTLDPALLPLGVEIELLFEKRPDLSLVLAGAATAVGQ